MRRQSALVVAALILVTLGGCGGGGASSDAQKAASGQRVTTTTAPLDRSPFCVAIRKLDALSTASGPDDATLEEVLAQNTELRTVVDEASASAPTDAPATVRTLFEDYRALSAAVEAAGGDTDAAFNALNNDQPELAARLTRADAYTEAAAFFADRCGTARPT